MPRLFSSNEDHPRPDEKSWITINKAKQLETGSQDFTRLDGTESKAFKAEPKSQYTAEYVKNKAIHAALDLADVECYAGRLSWHRSMRLDWILQHLNRRGFFASKQDVLFVGDKRL